MILEADPAITTLLDFHYQRHYTAERGTHGQGSNKHGRSATAESLNQSIAAPSDIPAAAAVETPNAPAQMDFWLDSTPAAGPAAAPKT